MDRNFIWSGDILNRKLVSVSWSKLCSNKELGGIGIRSLRAINEASLLKLSWEMVSSNQDWAVILRSKYLRHNSPILYHVKSSIWSAIKLFYSAVKSNTCWMVGDGASISLWKDYLLPECTESLAEFLNIPGDAFPFLKASVKDIIYNNEW